MAENAYIREDLKKTEAHRHTFPEGFSGMAEAYLENAKERNFSPNTILDRRKMYRRFVSFLAARNMEGFKDVGIRTLEDYRLSMLDGGLSPNTVQTHMGAIRMLFDFLTERSFIFENPARCMILHKQIRALKDVLTEDETRKLLAVPDTSNKVGLRDRALLETLYSTGVRREELVRMTVYDVDTERQTIRVLGKGRKERTLPLGKIAAKYVELYMRHSRPKLRDENSPRADMLWWSIFRIPLGIQMPRKIVRLYAREAGIAKKISTHTMRRSCATHMLRNGAHPMMVAELLGHACLKTLSSYLQVTMADLSKTHGKSNPGK